MHTVLLRLRSALGRKPSIGYFDLGSSTNLGNYGGDDHLFWPDTAGFRLEMDVENARPHTPLPKPKPSPKPDLKFITKMLEAGIP